MIEVVVVLIVLMIAAAIVAVESASMLFSVISVGAVGFLLAIAFVFLAAPDIAIVQVAVEVIALVVLVRACGGRDTEPEDDRPDHAGRAAAVTLLLVTGLIGMQVFASFPPFGETVMERLGDAPSAVYLEHGLADTGAANIVTAVLLDFRAYDTLGEATVLFCAVLGALAVLRRRARPGVRDEDEDDWR